jgi:hypothetical protein
MVEDETTTTAGAHEGAAKADGAAATTDDADGLAASTGAATNTRARAHGHRLLLPDVGSLVTLDGVEGRSAALPQERPAQALPVCARA